jgi:hypothetical protein
MLEKLSGFHGALAFILLRGPEEDFFTFSLIFCANHPITEESISEEIGK